MSAEAQVRSRWKPYPEYRDSGVEWLPEVPSGWPMVRNGALFVERNERGFPALPALSVSIASGVTRQTYTDDQIIRSSDDKSQYKRAAPRDAVYNKMRLWQGAIGVAAEEGIVSPAYVVCSLSSTAEARFIEYALRSPLYTTLFGTESYGICDDMNSCRYIDFKTLYTALPPLPEQQAIADFLDRETGKIDALVARMERLVELLQEKRTALISHVVTKGLDPTVPMKDSGIEWLGEVPEGWAVSSVRAQFDFLDHRRVPLSGEDRSYMAKAYPYYGASGVIDHVEGWLFEEPLLLVGEDGANLLLRSSPLAFIARGRYWVNNHAHVLRPRGGSLEYWEGVLRSATFEPAVTGSAQPKLTKQNLGGIVLAVPPPAEQQAIADYLDTETAKIDALVAKTQEGIGKLTEYRTALISAAVTGKIDVRGECAPLDTGGEQSC